MSNPYISNVKAALATPSQCLLSVRVAHIIFPQGAEHCCVLRHWTISDVAFSSTVSEVRVAALMIMSACTPGRVSSGQCLSMDAGCFEFGSQSNKCFVRVCFRIFYMDNNQLSSSVPDQLSLMTQLQCVRVRPLSELR